MVEEAKKKASPSKFRTSIGGQALIEGVLMRGPGKQAIVVRSPEGEISLDFKGKAPGRGAYICPAPACLKQAIKAKALERAFSTQIPEAVYEKLNEEMEAEK